MELGLGYGTDKVVLNDHHSQDGSSGNQGQQDFSHGGVVSTNNLYPTAVHGLENNVNRCLLHFYTPEV